MRLRKEQKLNAVNPSVVFAMAHPPEATEMVNVPAVTRMKWTHFVIFDESDTDGPFILMTTKSLDARRQGKKDWQNDRKGKLSKSAVNLSRLELEYTGGEPKGERRRLRRVKRRGSPYWEYRIFAKIEHSVSKARMLSAVATFNDHFAGLSGTTEKRYAQCCRFFFSR